MKNREKSLGAALAMAAAAFVSAPGTAAAQETKARRRIGYRMFSGPLSVRVGQTVRFNAWRPPGGEKCGLRMTTTFLDARKGTILGQNKAFTLGGDGATAEVSEVPGRVGVRVRMTPAADFKLGVRACDLTGGRRVVGGKGGPVVRGSLEILNVEGDAVTVVGASDLKPLFAEDPNGQ